MTLLPGAIWVGPINSDNYTPTRYGVAVSEIIDHHTDTDTWQQALAAFNAAYGSGKGRSAHLIIDRNDPVNDIYQCVDLDHMAWGAANGPANLRGVNIEHVRPWDSGYLPITDGQYRKSHDVHVQLSQMFGFPLDADHVHGHNFYWPTTCPGDMDLARLIEGDDMTPEEHQMLVDIKAALGGPGAPVIAQLQTLSKWLGYVGGQPEPTVGADLKKILSLVEGGAGGGTIPPDVAANLATIAAGLRKLGTP